jgi:hypothetical protein
VNSHLKFEATCGYLYYMTVADIMTELPSLTEAERWALISRLRQLVHDDVDHPDQAFVTAGRGVKPTSQEVQARLNKVDEGLETAEGEANLTA